MQCRPPSLGLKDTSLTLHLLLRLLPPLFLTLLLPITVNSPKRAPSPTKTVNAAMHHHHQQRQRHPAKAKKQEQEQEESGHDANHAE